MARLTLRFPIHPYLIAARPHRELYVTDSNPHDHDRVTKPVSIGMHYSRRHQEVAMSRTRERVLFGLVGCALIATAPLHMLGAQGSADAGRRPNRRPTCARGLREYETARDIPTPYDTVIARPSGQRFVPNGGPNDVELLVRRDAAAAGATGYVKLGSRPLQNGSASVATQLLLVFVPTDTARVYSECAKPLG